jgi:hypothetical protein
MSFLYGGSQLGQRSVKKDCSRYRLIRGVAEGDDRLAVLCSAGSREHKFPADEALSSTDTCGSHQRLDEVGGIVATLVSDGGQDGQSRCDDGSSKGGIALCGFRQHPDEVGGSVAILVSDGGQDGQSRCDDGSSKGGIALCGFRQHPDEGGGRRQCSYSCQRQWEASLVRFSRNLG